MNGDLSGPIKEKCTALGELLAEKNRSYGSAFAKAADFLRLLFPEGIPTSQYDDLVLIVRIFDKMMRIATRAPTEDPWQDIAGYGVLGLVARDERPDFQSTSSSSPSQDTPAAPDWGYEFSGPSSAKDCPTSLRLGAGSSSSNPMQLSGSARGPGLRESVL